MTNEMQNWINRTAVTLDVQEQIERLYLCREYEELERLTEKYLTDSSEGAWLFNGSLTNIKALFSVQARNSLWKDRNEGRWQTLMEEIRKGCVTEHQYKKPSTTISGNKKNAEVLAVSIIHLKKFWLNCADRECARSWNRRRRVNRGNKSNKIKNTQRLMAQPLPDSRHMDKKELKWEKKNTQKNSWSK